MVEGAVIFPVMSIFLVLLELSHHSFDGYIEAGHVARERAWSAATAGSIAGGCDGGRDDQNYKPSYFSSISGSGGSTPQGGPTNVQESGRLGGITGGDSSRLIISKHQATVTVNVSIKRGPRSYAPTPKAMSSVYCNQPFIGGLFDIISQLWNRR